MNAYTITLLAGCTVAVFAGGSGNDDAGPLGRSITVVGSGEVTAKPDMAEIQAGVVSQATLASEALKANSTAMKNLLSTLATRGVAERDVQTSQFQVAPMHKRGPRGEQQAEIAGYQVTNQVRVRVRELDKLGAVLDELVTAGANQLHGISFSLANPSGVLDDARKQAMADARRKAELYAREGGVKLERVLLIQEQPAHVPRPQMFGFARAEAEMAVPIAAGENTFHATITVTYAID